jgi:hypothetical protein
MFPASRQVAGFLPGSEQKIPVHAAPCGRMGLGIRPGQKLTREKKSGARRRLLSAIFAALALGQQPNGIAINHQSNK